MTADYLTPSNHSFWRWQDEGQVLAWADGDIVSLIAFRQELHGVLARQADLGLPPLGAVAMLLAATRASWPETSGKLGSLLRGALDTDESFHLVPEVIQLLDRVADLPPELKHSVEAKAALADLVFQDCSIRLPSEASEAIVEELGQRWTGDPGRRTEDFVRGCRTVLADLYLLKAGLPRVDEPSLRLRLRTGLDQLPEPADAELPPAERVRKLLAELSEDDRLRGLAKLARELMAAITLPREVADPEDIPLGGVSDLANRGPLDRLLLSELAHDDLTLAVRVATNEALYLRRESPPRTPPRQRRVLLECGIRSWGVPRVFSTAVALALAAKVERNMEVRACRAEGDSVVPVDLTTRKGLEEQLERLTTELHPGPALGPFQRQLSAAEEAVEPVLVTTDDVLEDVDFQRDLARARLRPMLAIALSRAGRCRVLELTDRGRRQISEALLSLEDLFAEPQRAVPSVRDRSWAGDLPAIFKVDPFPLLLPHALEPSRTWRAGNIGILAVTNDGRLTLWTHAKRGARQIADDLPGGKLWWSSEEVLDGRLQAVVGQASEPHLLSIDLSQMSCETRPLHVEGNVQGIAWHNGVLFAIHRRQVQVFDRGVEVERMSLPRSASWSRQRFFEREGSTWWALAYDGHTARLEWLLEPAVHSSPPLITMLERSGLEGALGVTATGEFYESAKGEMWKVEHRLTGQVEVVGTSAHGRRLALASTDAPHEGIVVVDTETRSVVARGPRGNDKLLWLADPMYRRRVRPRNLRHRFTHIGVHERGALVLTSRKRQRVAIQYDRHERRIRLRLAARWSDTCQQLAFRPVSIPQVGFQLSRAAWDDGSQAVLDTRGLLHLKSSDSTVPEVTLVLSEGAMAGWCSDGRLWGAGGHFVGDADGAPQEGVYDTAIRPFIERLPWSNSL